jgi:hypothetical protein
VDYQVQDYTKHLKTSLEEINNEICLWIYKI